MECIVRTLTPDGVGIAVNAKGERIRVVGTIPGERVEVAVQGYVEGQAFGVPERFTRQHPERQEAYCPELGRCPRCPLMNYPASLQQSVRASLVQRFLFRAFGEETVRSLNATWSGLIDTEQWAHRVRYRYRVYAPGDVAVGFYRPDQTTIEPLSNCAIARGPMGTLLPRITEALAKFSIEGTGQVVVVMDHEDTSGQVSLCFRAEDGHFPDPDWFHEICSWDWPVRGIRVVDREMRERYQWGDTRYIPLASARTDDVIRATVGLPIEDDPLVLGEVQKVLNQWLDDHDLSESRILELFAGVGIHTALLHPRASFVDAVTTPARAIDDLHANFDAVPKDRVRRTYASMARGLSRTYCKEGAYDFICAWIPRRGAVGLWRTIDQIKAKRWLTTHADILNSTADLKRILGYGAKPKRIHLIPCEPHRLRTQAVIEWAFA